MQNVYKVEFHFDPISPYSWLAARQCSRLDAGGAALDFRPVLFAGLLAAHGNKGPADMPAKRAYTMRDVLRQAARLGVPAKGPPTPRSIHCMHCACASRSTTRQTAGVSARH